MGWTFLFWQDQENHCFPHLAMFNVTTGLSGEDTGFVLD